MKIREIMTRECRTCPSDATARQAAQMMAENGIGALPVEDGDQLVGVLTDRDLVVRGAAEGCDFDKTPARELMSQEVLYCFDDQSVEQVSENMAEQQVRRMPVVNRDKRLVGMVSLGDFARRGDASDQAERALRGISEPG